MQGKSVNHLQTESAWLKSCESKGFVCNIYRVSSSPLRVFDKL